LGFALAGEVGGLGFEDAVGEQASEAAEGAPCMQATHAMLMSVKLWGRAPSGGAAPGGCGPSGFLLVDAGQEGRRKG